MKRIYLPGLNWLHDGKSAMLTLAAVALLLGMAHAQLTADQRNDFLNTHNAKRRAVSPAAANMREMVWSTPLERVAQAYANKCIWRHNPNLQKEAKQQNAGFSYVGENLYLTSGRGLSTRQAVANGSTISWDNERSDYTYSSTGGGRCNSGKVCGHFTQLAWATSFALGCGIADCSTVTNAGSITQGTMVVCNYGPGGNYAGQSPWISGTSCSNCPRSVAENCNAGLCTNGTGTNGSGAYHAASPHPVLFLLLFVTFLFALN